MRNFVLKTRNCVLKNGEFCSYGDGTVARQWPEWRSASKNDDFCIKNDEFCIKNDKFCIRRLSAMKNATSTTMHVMGTYSRQTESVIK